MSKYLLQPNSDISHTSLSGYSFVELLTSSVIHYANKDAVFAKHLQSLIVGLAVPPSGGSALCSKENVAIIELTTRDQAMRRADWLASMLERQALPHSHKASAMLSTWGINRAEEDPKAIILGIKIGVMPVGIFGEHKLQEQMPIIARKGIEKLSVKDFTNLTTHASLSTLHRALDAVSGNARMLEPEMGDWFYGEKTLIYYQATLKEMNQIQKELETSSIPHATSSDENGIAVLAMSPSVNSKYPEIQWNLDPFQ